MKHRLALVAATFVVASAAPAVAPVSHVAPAVAVAKTCSAGFTQARINGSDKCLRRGQFCARTADHQYRRYGFRCIKRDANGRYHLT